MSAGRTMYHVLFAELLKERAPPGFRVIPELTLSTEPQRADFLILCKEGETRHDDQAGTLKRLWPLLPSDTVVEYKSPSRPLRRGDLARLLGYGAQYHSTEIERLRSCSELALVLVVASLTPTLEQELATFRWRLTAMDPGYYRLESQPYEALVVVVDDVAGVERDELLELMGHRKMVSDEAQRWFWTHTVQGPEGAGMEKLEGYDELVKRALAQMPTRLRLEGLSPDEQVLALSDEVLKRFPVEFVDTFPEKIRDEIRRRLAMH